MEVDREQLANSIKQELSSYFNTTPLIGSLKDQRRKSTTRAVKEFLCEMGHSRGFKVAASECKGFDNPEWLYDMVWYELAEDKRIMTRQSLVMECELVPDPQVDDDFQKLVQARADVRLWIACLPNEEIAGKHLDCCKRQATLFSGAVSGDIYIFVTDNWTTPKTSIEHFVVGG